MGKELVAQDPMQLDQIYKELIKRDLDEQRMRWEMSLTAGHVEIQIQFRIVSSEQKR